MKKFTLRKMLFLYFLGLVGSVFILCLLLYGAFMMGVRRHVYSLANSEEKQVEALSRQITAEQTFDPAWVPKGIEYTLFDKKDRPVSSNASASGQEEARGFLKGEDRKDSKGYFVKTAYREGTCVFKYHIGIRYYSPWAEQHLPKVELLFLLLLLLVILLPTLLYVHAITRRIYRDVLPLQRSVISIGQGDLNVPLPELSIYEFKELGMLTERMRLDLKGTLETLWSDQHRFQEEVTRMLHDYRSPLTVARAKAEFLWEDLACADCGAGERFLKDVDAIIFNLERLTEVAEGLQLHMKQGEKQAEAQPSCTFREFNSAIDRMGEVLSRHYGDVWEGCFQEAEGCLPVEERSFRQALANVLVNGFEHGKSPQTVRLRFTLSRTEAEYLLINSGSCFSREALEQGTRKGFSEKTEERQTVKGMGLYFVKEFLEEHDGKLFLSNTREGYACVRITLPIKE